ncbi:MAG TPA: SDR family NAD(P)-dependent oxidoreductase [Acidimicrobiales bacterium]|nr:SDR family NAD(P)-dependent oxidoreductase [Acidimicrobiales bacterium]
MSAPPLPLADQVALVTGASGAIGSHLAVELARRGAHVVAIDLLDTKSVVARITSEGGRAIGIEADLRDEVMVNRAFDEALAWRGRVDVLVNMVGVYYDIPRVPFWEIDVEVWDDMICSNVRTVFLCCKAASAPMRQAGRGRIVNVSSNVSVFGMVNFMHYVAAKAAVVGMTRSMARELGPFGVAVNAVAPGLVRTPNAVAELAPAYLQAIVDGQMLRTPIEIGDVVNAVAFLACDESRVVTGQTLLVNAGAMAGSF